jgi:hypothetical protein
MFSFSLIGRAAFASDEDSKLPACCRRAGLHRCAAILGAQTGSSGPAIHASPCANFLGAAAAPTFAKKAFSTAPQMVFASVASRPAARPQAEVLYRISFARTRQKRGPPLFFS